MIICLNILLSLYNSKNLDNSPSYNGQKSVNLYINTYKGDASMARKGENIYKRKDGRWEGRYIKTHFNGKIKYGYCLFFDGKSFIVLGDTLIHIISEVIIVVSVSLLDYKFLNLVLSRI